MKVQRCPTKEGEIKLLFIVMGGIYGTGMTYRELVKDIARNFPLIVQDWKSKHTSNP